MKEVIVILILMLTVIAIMWFVEIYFVHESDIPCAYRIVEKPMDKLTEITKITKKIENIKEIINTEHKEKQIIAKEIDKLVSKLNELKSDLSVELNIKQINAINTAIEQLI